MPEVFKPARPADVAAALAQAKGAIEVRGRGSKRALGRPTLEGLALLDLSGLAGITLYEPEELVMSARAGTQIADVRAAPLLMRRDPERLQAIAPPKVPASRPPRRPE